MNIPNALSALLTAAILIGQTTSPLQSPGVPWPATDALGRKLPLPDEVGLPRSDRTVGIFYFLTHSEAAGRNPEGDGPYDVSKILARDPDAIRKPNSPLWGPIGMFHYWGEPLYGYYRSDDTWVLRRHAHLLAAAGIDTLIFDTTNAVTYPEVYMKLCEVFRQVRKEGGRTPQIAFMVNTEAGKTAQRIYEDLYKPSLYPELWFRWQGKPLMICDPADASPELKQFFALRRAHWPFTMVNTPFAWHWEAAYPQPYGYTDDSKHPEQVNVSVAQNLRQSDGKVTNMSNLDARGRSFHDGKLDTSPGAVKYGHNFQEQWKRAFDLVPPFVMVTGWNEWTAGRFGKPDGPIVFVDQLSQEFSRDIEPMAPSPGGHGDNYYWQLVANVRRYKGAPPTPKATHARTIRIQGPFSQWEDVGPEFRADTGGTIPRNHAGVVGLHYENRTGRNEFERLKVARDKNYVYFYARTKEPIVSGSPERVWLLIDTDQNSTTGWQGYDFMVNRTVDRGTAWLERNTGGFTWRKVAPVSYRIEERELHLAIPRKALGIQPGRVSLDFKWADNIQKPGDIMDFYLSGDVAPLGRFNFRYTGE